MARRRAAAPQRTLSVILVRQGGRRTVLGIALPILQKMSGLRPSEPPFRGMTAGEIRGGFNELSARYLKCDFSTTYLARPLGPRGFLELRNGLYSFRPELIANMAATDFARLYGELLQSLQDAVDRRRADIARLDQACRMPMDRTDERRALVEEYLRNFGGNLGENFEIISYAILREYFASFGFRLQRFSTTHANDGGMDYVGGDHIYQVSTDGGVGKLESDMAKAPDIKRVVVRPALDDAARARADEADLSRIELADLLTHFAGWLIGRDAASRRPGHLQRVLETALAEFRREDKAEHVTTARSQ